MVNLFEILTKKNSGMIAKKRLQFVLIADRAGCTPEIDTSGLEIKITQMEDQEMSEKLPVLYVSMPVRVLLTKGTY